MKKLKPHAVDWSQIDRSLASAEKKLASAHKILAFDEEAPSASLRSNAQGFPWVHGQPWIPCEKSAGHHIAIIDFVRSRIDRKHAGLLVVFDRLRRRRNIALYDDTGFISHHDAEQTLESAGDYLSVVRADIANREP